MKSSFGRSFFIGCFLSRQLFFFHTGELCFSLSSRLFFFQLKLLSLVFSLDLLFAQFLLAIILKYYTSSIFFFFCQGKFNCTTIP